jgi:hypothetical protein
MASGFAWLDHSDKERRKVLDAIDRFKESDTRDELGLAAIRDGLADYFFPGTGVLMTRARYFFFVPWMYLEIERRGFRDDVEARARRAEAQLIDTLDQQPGTIGRLARGTLKRMPSSIYWLGLRAWGIRSFGGTQSEYHMLLDRGVGPDGTAALDDDGEPVDGRVRRNWHGAIPRAPLGFPKQATFDLTSKEAIYLRERIRLSAPQSLLALLFRSPLPDVAFAWQHPALGSFPDEMREALHHAQCFAETMHGAALLYNLMLAEADKREEKADDFRRRIGDWRDELGVRARELATWKLHDFWAFVRSKGNVSEATVRFVNHWLELRAWETRSQACGDAAARILIQMREQRLKGPRARLSNARALEVWGGASGTGRLSLRWEAAHRLVADIVAGLGREVGDA